MKKDTIFLSKVCVAIVLTIASTTVHARSSSLLEQVAQHKKESFTLAKNEHNMGHVADTVAKKPRQLSKKLVRDGKHSSKVFEEKDDKAHGAHKKHDPRELHGGSYGGPVDLSEYQIGFSGFVKTETIFDSRQVAGPREDHLSLFPLPFLTDGRKTLACHFPNCNEPATTQCQTFNAIPEPDCKDLNGRPQFHMLAIQSRLRTHITGPKVGSANVTAFLEADFTGPWVVNNRTDHQVGFQSVIDGLFLRHAFIRFDWPNTSFLTGLYWHPLVPPESVSHDSVTFMAAPFEPIGRHPQLRFTHLFEPNFEIILAATGQLDFKSKGPFGFSTKYLRTSVTPNLHLQSRLYLNEHVLGFALDYKRLIPRFFTTPGPNCPRYKTTNAVNSVSFMTYARLLFERTEIKLKLTYGENLTDQVMLSGYGLSDLNPETGEEKYTPLSALAFVADIYRRGKVEPGLLFGLTKNLGALHDKLFTLPNQIGNNRFVIFGIGDPDPNPDGTTKLPGLIDTLPNFINTIDYMINISPRVKWHLNPVTIAAEFEFLRAVYGELDECGRVQDTKVYAPIPSDPSAGCVSDIGDLANRRKKKAVHNLRFTLAFYYYF